MSSGGDRFIKLLTQTGYPEVDKLDPASFHWMFEDEDLKPLMEVLCSDVTEENILTAEEFEQYTALVWKNFSSSSEERLSLDSNTSSKPISEELQDLLADVASAEKCIRMLENQKKALSMQQLAVAKETEELEEARQGQLQAIQKLHIIELPALVNEMNSALQDVINLIEELSSAFDNSSAHEGSARCFFQADIKPYIEAEEKVLKNVEHFLNNSFQKNGEVGTSKCIVPQLSTSELQTQQLTKLSLLKHVLQISEEDYISGLLQVVKHESQIKFCKDMEEKDFRVYDVPVQQLRAHVEQGQQKLKQYRTVKEQLLAELLQAVADITQRQCDYIGTLMTKETLQQYRKNLEVIEKPMDVLCSQRARLELFQASMATEKKDLSHFLSQVQSLKKQVEAEVKEILHFTKHHEEIINKDTADNDYVKEGTILDVVNSVLDGDSSNRVVFTKAQDVQKKFESFELQEQKLVAKSEAILKQQLNWISTMEEAVSVLENHVLGKDLDTRHPLHQLQLLSTNLKKLDIDIQDFEGRFLTELKIYQKKAKMVAQNPNLSKARKLFVYALTNQAKFEASIEELQNQMPTSKASSMK